STIVVARYGQLSGSGCGRKGRVTMAIVAEQASTSTVVSRVSPAPLTMAFQPAWRRAAKRTMPKAARDTRHYRGARRDKPSGRFAGGAHLSFSRKAGGGLKAGGTSSIGAVVRDVLSCPVAMPFIAT